MKYYCNIWSIQSHTLVTLDNITSSKVKCKWTKIEKCAFDEIKRIVAHDTLLPHPDSNKEFKINTNSSDLQLGVVINQKDKMIALNGKKLTESQRRYTVIERNVLGIVETLKEFITIIIGQRLIIHTDNKNLTCKYEY